MLAVESLSGMILMTFPRHEWDQLKRRLMRGNPIYTTRISKEQGRYKKGMRVKVPFWKTVLSVMDVKTFDHIEDHPFYDELTAPQIKEIEGNRFDVVKLGMIKVT